MEVRCGLFDASLGGNLVKKRLPISGRGKSSGLRLILACNASTENVFCIYLFAKNETDNISNLQLQQLKKFAKTLLSLKHSELENALKKCQLQEVMQNDDKDI